MKDQALAQKVLETKLSGFLVLPVQPQAQLFLVSSDFLFSLWSLLCLYSSSSKWPGNAGTPQGSVLGALLSTCSHLWTVWDFKQHLEADDSQMFTPVQTSPLGLDFYIQLKNPPKHFTGYLKPNTYKTTLSIPIHTPLPVIQTIPPQSALFSGWHHCPSSGSSQKPESHTWPLPLMYTYIQHQVLQFIITARLGHSHV